MCWCNPSLRTPCCGGINCHPPTTTIDKSTVLAIINKHCEGTVETIDDTFLTGDWESYTDDFYYNAAHILEDILKELEKQ